MFFVTQLAHFFQQNIETFCYKQATKFSRITGNSGISQARLKYFEESRRQWLKLTTSYPIHVSGNHATPGYRAY